MCYTLPIDLNRRPSYYNIVKTIMFEEAKQIIQDSMKLLENGKITSLRSTVNVGGGGYAYRGDNAFGSCDYCTPKLICEMAKLLKMPVHLAGDWSIVGRKGYGELVSALEFDQLLVDYVNTHPNGKFVKQNYF